MQKKIEHLLRKVDSWQQSHGFAAFIFGVIKKYGDDRGGNLTKQLTYTMFVTVFPLLLLLVTILTLVLAADPSAKKAVLDSTFSQFPVIGSQLSNNIHVLRRDSLFGLIVGILGLIYGTTGLAGAGLFTMEQVWNIEGPLRPNFITRKLRGLVFLIVLAAGLVITTVLSGFGTYGRHDFWLGIVAEVFAVIVNFGLYFAAFRVLTPKHVKTKDLVPGAVFGAVIWTILQALGGYVVGHYLKTDNATYGVFGVVLGLIAWIYIGAEVTVYSAVMNNVLSLRLWPRSLIQPPLTKADQISINLQATQNRRRPEQQVISTVKGLPTDEKQYLSGQDERQVIGTPTREPKKNQSD